MIISKSPWAAWLRKFVPLFTSTFIFVANSYGQVQEPTVNRELMSSNLKWEALYSNNLHDAFLSDEFEVNISNSVDVWVLINLKPETKLTDGSRSILTKRRYDCLNEKFSIYIFKSYSEYFGKGKLITDQVHPINWRSYEPGSDAEYIINIACKGNYSKK